MDVVRSVRSYLDELVALALSVAFQLQVWFGVGLSSDETSEGAGPWGVPATALAGLAFTASLAVRARWPLIPLGLAFPVLVTMGPGGLDGAPALAVAVMVATWSVGTGTRDTRAIIGAVGVAGLIGLAMWRDPDAATSGGDLLVPIVLIGGPWIAGLVTRIRRDQAEALRRRAASLERDRDASRQAAAAAERARIARELHDIVAHAISVVVVQARGARHSLPVDPVATGIAIDAIEATGVDALTEMRRLLGIIGDATGGADPAELAPQPGLDDLERLVGRIREAGLPVEVTIDGEPRRLPAGVDLSAYRIVQEALTNALRHAGTASARVHVRYSGPGLDLEIVDTGRGDPDPDAAAVPGRGLIGMRERAALVGGVVEAGPAAGGGYVVRAHLPVARAGS